MVTIKFNKIGDVTCFVYLIVGSSTLIASQLRSAHQIIMIPCDTVPGSTFHFIVTLSWHLNKANLYTATVDFESRSISVNIIGLRKTNKVFPEDLQ